VKQRRGTVELLHNSSNQENKESKNQRSRRKAETERSNTGQSSFSPPAAPEPGKSLLLSFAL
jgi:hypothetical protein